MKRVFILFLMLAGVWVFAAEVAFSEFENLSGAAKANWRARSSGVLSVPRHGVLRVQGNDARRYCGMELVKVPPLDYSGSIKCKVKMNFGKHIYFALSTANGYFDIYFEKNCHNKVGIS